MKWSHLHVHTDYSVLDGCSMVGELADLAKQYGMEHLAVTDHGNMSAVPAQTMAAKKAGLKPVYGIEFYINNYAHLREAGDLTEQQKKLVRKSNHLLALAMTERGYRNLVQLSSWAWQEGFYFNPRINWEVLKAHSDDIIVTTGCLASEFQQLLMAWSEGDSTAIRKVANLVAEYKEVFGDRFYVETQMIGIEEQDRNNPLLLKLADQFDIPAIITNDVHFARGDQKILHQTMLEINTGKGDMFDSSQLWYKSAEEMIAFHEAQGYTKISRERLVELMQNSYEVAKRCEDVVIDTQPKLPEIAEAGPKLAERCFAGMKAMGLIGKQEYRDRLKYELSIIMEKGYESYFLIEQECINHVRSSGFSPGPGRGSAAGSLVCYLLGITEVDPIANGLIFERFLNPARGGRFARLKPGEPVEPRRRIDGVEVGDIANPMEHGASCRCGSCHPLADADLPSLEQVQEALSAV